MNISVVSRTPEATRSSLIPAAAKPRTRQGEELAHTQPINIPSLLAKRPIAQQPAGNRPIANRQPPTANHDPLPFHEERPIAHVTPQVSAKLAKLKEASQQFEGLMVKDLIGKMHMGLSDSSSPMAGLVNDMFDQAISESVGKSGSLGIANLLYSKLADALAKQTAAEAPRVEIKS